MSKFSRILCAVALLAAAVTFASAVSNCGIEHCTSCLSNYCTWCEDGYYVDDGACVACGANCRSCSIAGFCTSCNDGYKISYASSDSDGPSVNLRGTCVEKGTPASCTDPQCTSCIAGTCLFCGNGYYLKDGACVSCAAAHCTHCGVAGHCFACEAGYRLRYARATDSEVIISRWGTCSNAATTAPRTAAALIGAAAVAAVLLLSA